MIPGISPLISHVFVEAGSVLYDIPGNYDFICPNFNTLTITVKGAGAGGGSFSYSNSVTGGSVISLGGGIAAQGEASLFNNTLIGVGSGSGGQGSWLAPSGTRTVGANGPNGTGSGGDTNTTGGGGAGGSGGSDSSGILGGLGGSGGLAIKLYARGELIFGKSYPIVVGKKGLGVPVFLNTAGFTHPQGYDGTDGSVLIEWE